MKNETQNETRNEADKKALSFFNPKMILAMLPMLIPFLPMILIAFGTKLKSGDPDNTGADDVFGKVMIDLAPAVAAIGAKDESKAKAAARVARDTLNGYLGE